MDTRYAVAQLDALPALDCSCGATRRAFVEEPGADASVHLVDISKDATVHFHAEHTECYIVLEGEGHLELDGEMVPVKPLTTILIKPGCRHRAVGDLRILNISVPVFDGADEHLA